MDGINKAISHLLTNSTNSHSDYHCSICHKHIPKTEIEILGRKHLVQSKCECEIKKFEKEMKDMQELQTKRMIEQKFSVSKLGERFESSRFETFKAREGTLKAFNKAKHYADNFNAQEGEGMLLWGDPGNGKSHLAAAVTHELKSKGKTVVFQSVPELLVRIKSTFGSNKESEKEIMDALLQCQLLVLDDIGAEKVTDWVQDVMFRIVDGRYRQKKPIFYTTNFKPSELLDKLGPRIYDRIVETSILVQNQGTSWRREIGKQRYKGDFE